MVGSRLPMSGNLRKQVSSDRTAPSAWRDVRVVSKYMSLGHATGLGPLAGVAYRHRSGVLRVERV